MVTEAQIAKITGTYIGSFVCKLVSQKEVHREEFLKEDEIDIYCSRNIILQAKSLLQNLHCSANVCMTFN